MGVEANSETGTRQPWRRGRWICLATLMRSTIVKVKAMRVLVLLLCLLMVGCGTTDPQRPRARASVRKGNARRPPKRQALSPVGGYVVTSETPDAKKPQRDIVITRPGEKRELLRYPFQRQVDVVWAPDESAVAVVDLVLANETRVVVFELPSARPLYELRREHICELNPELPCGELYSHVFLSAVVWLAPDRIQVAVDMMNPLERGLAPQVHGSVIATFPR